jgi:3-(3-hydroxy-phenyl)propionate hydroxylase
VTGVKQDADGVTVATDAGTWNGDYLIGADGASSAVRRAIGVDFEGLTYPERFYVVATGFEFDKAMPRLSDVNYVADTEEWCVLLRVPGSWRCLFPTRPDEPEAEVLSDECTEKRLQAVCPREDRYETLHRSIYAVHQRVAARYRVGRVFLAGDSAHINNPLGGMGMNGGIHDAVNLCEKLIAVHRGAADELDRYERQRRPIAIEYINANTARNRQLMNERDPAARRASQETLCRQAADPVAAKAFLMKSSMIDALRAAERIP